MICFQQLITIDMFPHTDDINSIVSRHVECIVMMRFVEKGKI